MPVSGQRESAENVAASELTGPEQVTFDQGRWAFCVLGAGAA
jgi:hypothetical protein